MAFDISGAKKAGFTDEQINAYQAMFPQKEKSFMGFLENVGNSGTRFVEDTAGAILNPLQTGKNFLQLVKNPMTLVSYYRDRYGKDLSKTLYEDPVGVLADLSTVLSAGAGVAGKIGQVGKMGKVAKVANIFGKAGKLTDPFGAVGKIAGKAGKLTGNVFDKAKVGDTMINVGENMLTKGLGSPQELSKIKGVSGKTMGELFRKYNLYDRSPEALQEAISGVNTARKGAIEAGSQGSLVEIVKSFNGEIARLKDKAMISDDAARQVEELTRRRNMVMKAVEGNFNPELSKLNEIKQGFQSDVPANKFGLPSSEMSKVGGTTEAYKLLLKEMERKQPGLKAMGRDESALIRLKDVIEKANNRTAGRQNLNFTKLGLGTVGGIAKGLPGVLAGFATEQIANSPQFLSRASRSLETAGKAIKNSKGISLPKLPNVPYGKIYQGAKMGRMINGQTTPTSQKQTAQVANTQQKAPSIKPQVMESSPSQTYNYQKVNLIKTPSAFGRTKTVKRGNFY